MKIIKSITFISILSLLVSCSKNKEKTTINDSPAIDVTVKEIIPNTKTPMITVSGKIQAAKSAELSTRMLGYVKNIYVNIGDKVNKGQLLLSINNSDLQAKKASIKASIIKAKVSFENAKKDYNRFKNLFAKNSISQKEMDDITTHYEMAKASLEEANQMLKEINSQFAYSNIRAPFSGIITQKFIEIGAMANPRMPLMSIESKQDGFEVITMIPETEISKIKTGKTVDVIIKSLNKTLKGKVSEISVSSKMTGGQYLVKIDLNKTDDNILSGMFVSVLFPVEQIDSAPKTVLIPSEILVKKGELRGIYTLSKENKALLRWLRLGRTFGNKTEVLSGLKKGEIYISSAKGKLYNGAKVSIQ